jgi:nitroimidazol reductase NimA-like FMN-containing flavoprotein (pyridoxamine 5'-phosphate oxidase superfamily)
MKANADIRKKTLNYLKQEQLMVLATASKTGEPHATAVFYLVDDDFNFYFVTKAKTSKNRNLERNRRVALSIGWGPPMNVQVHGTAKPVKDDRIKMRALAELIALGAARRDVWPPILHIEAGEYRMYRITPKSVHVLDLQSKMLGSDASPIYDLKF